MSAEFHDDNRSEEEKESYSFLKETIKKPPLNKKAVLLKMLKIAGLGVIFGLGACAGFSAAKPWVDSHFNNNPTSVTIPQDDKDEEEENPEETPQETQALTLDDYEEMYRQIDDVAKMAEKSLVRLSGSAGEEKTEDGQTIQGGQIEISGVIVADNGVEYLILAQNSAFQADQPVKAAFYDGNQVDVSVKKRDTALGIAVYAAPKSSLPDNTKEQIVKATLGNSNAASRGDPVIAAGMPFGADGRVGLGIISETSNTKLCIDGEYPILNTDMPGTASGSGVLLNLKGEVLGVICREEEDGGVLSALAISELKEEIELMSNGIGISYTGIEGTEVSDAVADSQEMPKGIYVSSTVPDSPAMKAGIQSGDILTEVENTKVYTMSAYRQELMDYRPGSHITIKGMRRSNDGYVDIQFEVALGSAE